MHKQRRTRTGAATVEAALIFPLIVGVFLGMLELSRGIMVVHCLQEASQAGCRVYSVEDTTQEQARAMIEQSMEAAGVTNFEIEFHPAEKSSIRVNMQPVTVAVRAPFENVAWVSPNFLRGMTLEGRSILPADLDISDGGDSNGYTVQDDDNPADGIERVDDKKDDDDDDD